MKEPIQISLLPGTYGGFEKIAEFGRLEPHVHPRIEVLQNPETREVRIDVYNCSDGLHVSYTNGGVDPEARKRHQKWYRNITTDLKGNQRVTVRFMARGDADHLRVKS